MQTQSAAPDPGLLIGMFGGLGLYLPDVRCWPWVLCQRSELEAGNIPESENYLPFSCSNWDPHHLGFEESSDPCPARRWIFDLPPRVAPGLHRVGPAECMWREGRLRPPPLRVPPVHGCQGHIAPSLCPLKANISGAKRVLLFLFFSLLSFFFFSKWKNQSGEPST